MSLKGIRCFILAGGKSSRFKKDKSFLFYKLQYKNCKKVFKDVIFTAKSKKFKKYPFFIEKSKTYAPIFALEELIRKYKKIFVISIDTPIDNLKVIRKLILKKAVATENPLIGYYDYTMLKNFDNTLRVKNINKNKLKTGFIININYQNELKHVNKWKLKAKR